MIPVTHGGHRRRSRWPSRNALLLALLCFCALQVAVTVTYYRTISAAKDRKKSAQQAGDDAAASRRLRSAPGAAKAASDQQQQAQQQQQVGQQQAGQQQQQQGSALPGLERLSAEAAKAALRRRYISRKEQAKLLLKSETYDERRVERLRALQDAAAERLEGGQAPPLRGTAVFPPGNEDGPCVGRGPPADGVVAAVVVVTFDRARYLEQTLASLLPIYGSRRGNRHKFSLFVSQDFNATGIQDVVERHLDVLSYLQHQEAREPVLENKKEKVVYYRIANHYKFILRTMFDCFGFQRVIILEDDMTFSPDLFSYFEATAPILDRDPTLYCVSAWNDHGQDRFVSNATLLYRSDFFPGLGWMLNRRVWESVRDIWPPAYWDDFMRRNSTRQGRQCIRPEVCRTYNFGDIGSSSGQYFRLFLKPVKLNDEYVDWQSADLSFLEADRYVQLFQSELAAAQNVSTIEEANAAEPGRDYVLRYNSQQNYEQLTGRLRMLREWRDGVPRGAYRGVVPLRNRKGARIFLAPTPDVDFHAVVAPPGMVLRVDATGALVRSRPRGAISTAEWVRQRQQRLEAMRAARAGGSAHQNQQQGQQGQQAGLRGEQRAPALQQQGQQQQHEPTAQGSQQQQQQPQQQGQQQGGELLGARGGGGRQVAHAQAGRRDEGRQAAADGALAAA